MEEKNKTKDEIYKDAIFAIKICLDSLKDIAETSPTNGVIRARALDTIEEVHHMLDLKEE